jgi:hypothetical protein
MVTHFSSPVPNTQTNLSCRVNDNANRSNSKNVSCVYSLVAIDRMFLLRAGREMKFPCLTFLSQALKTCQRFNLLSNNPLLTEMKTM